MKISACLITLNEEAHLGKALASLSGLVEEIVVVDSGSSDATESIARSFGARWSVLPWQGFVAQKNHALGLARHPWVFSLDADEELSPVLRDEVASLRSAGVPEEVAAYSMPRCVLYEGRWIRHGDWYPDRLVRLFRRDHARFDGGRVHERLVVAGRVDRLRGDLFHYSFADGTDHRARGRKYAALWAESAWEQGRRAGPGSAWTHAAFRWLRGYVLRRGFLDGAQGWRIAALSASETALKYRLLRERTRQG
jgi:glycosyltransferase involved in cell wall biosynthesis